MEVGFEPPDLSLRTLSHHAPLCVGEVLGLNNIWIFTPSGIGFLLTPKAPNITMAEFANTVDPDETAHYEPSHLDLKCLPSSL